MSKMKVKTIFVQIMVLMLTSIVSQNSMADAQITTTSLRRNIATVIFCGLGGAVLAISTLSFYGDPQNHVGDITTGFAVGLVAGATYVTLQATETKDQASLSLDPVKELATKNRNPRPALAYSWEF